MLKNSGRTALILLLTAVFLSQISIMAKEKPQTIHLGVSYSEKARTEREYADSCRKKASTPENTATTIEIEKSEFCSAPFRLEITPSISSENPELMIIKVKAWQQRKSYSREKTEDKWVEILDDTFRAKKGFPVITEEQIADDIDIRITVNANY